MASQDFSDVGGLKTLRASMEAKRSSVRLDSATPEAGGSFRGLPQLPSPSDPLHSADASSIGHAAQKDEVEEVEADDVPKKASGHGRPPPSELRPRPTSSDPLSAGGSTHDPALVGVVHQDRLLADDTLDIHLPPALPPSTDGSHHDGSHHDGSSPERSFDEPPSQRQVSRLQALASMQRAAPPPSSRIRSMASAEPLLMTRGAPVVGDASVSSHDTKADFASPVDPSSPEITRKPKRVYQNHPGNLMFVCNGRMMTSRPTTEIPLTLPRLPGPSRSFRRRPKTTSSTGRFGQPEFNPRRPSRSWRRQKTVVVPVQLIVSFFIVLFMGITFLASQSSYLSRRLSPGVPVVFAYLWLVCLAAMVKCSGSDPGIVPRGLDPEPERVWRSTHEEEEEEEPTDGEGQEKDGALRRRTSDMEVGEWEILPRWVEVRKVGGGGTQWIKCKWCQTCETYRPPRSSHCRLCNCCIDGIDHHCQYLNVCVGARNYRPFFVFVTSCLLGLLYIFAFSVYRLVDASSSHELAQKADFLMALRGSPLAFVLIVLSFVFTGPVSALWGYHFYLILSGVTTIEYLRLKSARQLAKRDPTAAAIAAEEDRAPQGDGSREVQGRLKKAWTAWTERMCRPETETWISWRRYDDDG